ncbi:MAG: hypothetical protein E7101_01355 [Prevotella ruminicola]|jgi:hypothetical protein|uniref:BT4734-like N-terminal domain-containing protein n=1 Tax=Xylanibacter ruminicola TaxID=839 RepID=A0A9D5S706_XYLRU|nr:hypothetical protein [Xylanibacter ruminicola]
MKDQLVNHFSVFGYGYRNRKGKAVLPVKPDGTATVFGIYQYIISDRARHATLTLRQMVQQGADRSALSDYKKLSFRIATFSGEFSYRNAKSLVSRSPYLVIDIDDLASESDARQLIQRFVGDTFLETELCFVSPKGCGVKWIFTLPQQWLSLTVKQQFEAARMHIIFHYGVEVDVSGSDVCRACFLPYDPQCYINPKHLK